MAEIKPVKGGWFWETFDPEKARSGADLAAIRKGLGRSAGTVSELMRFHRVVISDDEAARGFATPTFAAEHAALILFSVHQQSQANRMHKVGIRFGKAMLALRNSGRFSQEAVDRRVSSAATTVLLDDLLVHLRGLMTQLRTIKQPVDYTRLLHDLRDWQYPESQGRVRRRWGVDYYELPNPNRTPRNNEQANIPS